MMHGREKSDSVIVAVRSPNKAGEAAAEARERRAGPEENASQQRTRRTQSRESVSQTPERVRTAARFCRHYPRWEPDAGKPHVRFWAGGPGQPGSLPPSHSRRAAEPLSWLLLSLGRSFTAGVGHRLLAVLS